MTQQYDDATRRALEKVYARRYASLGTVDAMAWQGFEPLFFGVPMAWDTAQAGAPAGAPAEAHPDGAKRPGARGRKGGNMMRGLHVLRLGRYGIDPARVQALPWAPVAACITPPPTSPAAAPAPQPAPPSSPCCRCPRARFIEACNEALERGVAELGCRGPIYRNELERLTARGLNRKTRSCFRLWATPTKTRAPAWATWGRPTADTCWPPCAATGAMQRLTEMNRQGQGVPKDNVKALGYARLLERMAQPDTGTPRNVLSVINELERGDGRGRGGPGRTLFCRAGSAHLR